MPKKSKEEKEFSNAWKVAAKKDQEQFEAWVATRPPIIQKMVKQYPPGWYFIKEGAPYGITCPGSRVRLVGWSEDETVIVHLYSSDKLPEAIEHENRLCEKFGKQDQKESIHQKNVEVKIDGYWLEPIREA